VPSTTPTVAELKLYVRSQTTVDDALLTGLLARAVGRAERIIGSPIDARVQGFLISGSDRCGSPRHIIKVPASPIDVTTVPPVVLDAQGATVPASSYRADPDGLLIALAGWWDRWPYNVTVSWGLSLRPDYASVQPDLAQAIVDLAASWYEQRNAGASSETAGGGVRADYAKDAVPPRVLEVLVGLRRVPA